MVDPLIGTAHDGQTFPGVGAPFGMTQWTPQTQDGEAKCVAPYYFKDDRIQGFRDHAGGGTAQDRRCRASFPTSPRPEQTKPWHYGVTLEDSGIYAEMTGSSRAGLLRFRFSGSSEAVIVIQPNSRPAKARFT